MVRDRRSQPDREPSPANQGGEYGEWSRYRLCALCFGPLQNDYTQAIEVYKRALVIKPDFHAILVNLGSCHQQAWIAWIASGTVESKLASRLRVHRAHACGRAPVHVHARCVCVHVRACARSCGHLHLYCKLANQRSAAQ